MQCYTQCYILEDGSCVAWGNNDYGQHNIPNTGGRKFVQVSTGINHNVGILADGSAVVWGENRQCDIPDTGGRAFIQVSAGGWHNVAILEDGSCVGWGSNEYGKCDIGRWLMCGVGRKL